MQENGFFFIFTQHERNSTTGEFKFRCHFGEEECIGNKIHACSIKYVENPHDLHDYFNDIIDYQEELAEVAEEVNVHYKLRGSQYLCGPMLIDFITKTYKITPFLIKRIYFFAINEVEGYS